MTSLTMPCTPFLMQARECRTDTSPDVLRAYGVSDRGRSRPTNEDCFAVEEDLQLCVVADGMGGHQGGAVAARIAVDAIVELMREQRRPSEPASEPWPMGFDSRFSEAGNALRTAIQLAGLRVLEATLTDPSLAGMGTTAVAAIVCRDRLSVAHVGDSRLYVMSRGRLRLLTEDDSWTATMMARDPSADPTRFHGHPMCGALTNVVGSRMGTEVHVQDERLEPGDLVVLTTDGVHGALPSAEISRLLCDGAPCAEPQRIAERLVTLAVERGSRDNCTAVVASYCAD